MAKRKRRFMTPKAGRRKARKKRNLVSDRRKKEFTYRGRTVSELMEMPLLPSEDDPDAIQWSNCCRRASAEPWTGWTTSVKETTSTTFATESRKRTAGPFERMAGTSLSCQNSLGPPLACTMVSPSFQSRSSLR